jgi:hypothetical protein
LAARSRFRLSQCWWVGTALVGTVLAGNELWLSSCVCSTVPVPARSRDIPLLQDLSLDMLVPNNCPRKQESHTLSAEVAEQSLGSFSGCLLTGSFQSTGSAPCLASSWLARLNGREPKKPLAAEYGLGCADSTHGTPSSSGTSVRASRPHKIATSGASVRPASARMACSVTCSHPLPRCDPGWPGVTVSTRLSSSTPRSVVKVVTVFTVDIDQARRQPSHLGRDREAEADRMPGCGVRVLADDQHPDVSERLFERS